MKKLWLVAALAALTAPACATTYYVSQTTGNDTNAGTSAGTAWKTLAKVNGSTFAAGDAIYLKRGDVWREQLVPPSSGASGNPITFDAYGTGAAPVITAELDLSGNTWTYVSGNVWQTTMTSGIASPVVHYVRFGTVYGQEKTGTCASVVANPREFCVSWPTLFVYSPAGTSPTAYYPSVAPVAGTTAGLNILSISSKKWLTFQHIKVQTFDYIGVGTAGSADNLVFANMESDGMVPSGATSHGFYINASPAPTSIAFYNVNADLNYDGFHITGPVATAGITLVNCRGYANRNVGLKDGTNHAVYSYSHFYGNGISQFAATDVSGALDGGNNVSSDAAPAVANFARYAGRVTVTVDDVGLSAGTDTYINGILPMFTSRGLKMNAAITTGYPANINWGLVNAWYAAGHGVDSHSWSHQYYTTNASPQGAPPYPNTPAIAVKYTGTGTAAALTISGNVLTTAVTGAAGDNVSFNLANSPTDIIDGVIAAFNATGKYTAAYAASSVVVRGIAHAATLANVSGQDMKTATYNILFDQTKLLPDEMSASRAAILANMAGLGNLKVYVYPDGLKDPSTDAYAAAAGYQGARGTLSLRDTAGNTAAADAVAAKSVNVQDVTSLWLGPIHGMTTQQIQGRIASFVFRARAWGVPYGLFTHYAAATGPEVADTELATALDGLRANNATVMTNAALVDWIASGNGISGTTKYTFAATGAADLRAMPGSVTRGAGQNVGPAYAYDLGGNYRGGAWDIGANQVMGTAVAGKARVTGARVR